MHKLFEHHFTPFDTNEVIMTALRGSLHATTGKGGGLENRALDLDAFENVGPHIDWVALLARSI